MSKCGIERFAVPLWQDDSRSLCTTAREVGVSGSYLRYYPTTTAQKESEVLRRRLERGVDRQLPGLRIMNEIDDDMQYEQRLECIERMSRLLYYSLRCGDNLRACCSTKSCAHTDSSYAPETMASRTFRSADPFLFPSWPGPFPGCARCSRSAGPGPSATRARAGTRRRRWGRRGTPSWRRKRR